MRKERRAKCLKEKNVFFCNNLAKNKTNVVMMINFTMQKVCATTVTTNMEEQRNHGIVLMINYMQQECAKIVT